MRSQVERTLRGSHSIAAALGTLLLCLVIDGCSNFTVFGLLDTPPAHSITAIAGATTLALQPVTVNVPAGGTQRFVASGGSGGYSYSVQPGGAGGSIDSSGLYTAPAVSGTDSILVTDSSGASKESTAQVVLVIPLSITPNAITVSAGSTIAFTATGGTPPYFWTKTGGSGTFASSGAGCTYTTPLSAESLQITVTDSTGPTAASATASVIVTPPIAALTISPALIDVTAGDIVTFTASGGTGSYAFSLVAGAGSLSGASYTTVAAETAVIRVTDGAGGTADATVNVWMPLTLVPATVSVQAGGSYPFTTSGGKAPFTFGVTSGTGTIDSTGLFHAPAAAETDVVQVTDSLSHVSAATVTVAPATGWSIVSIDAASKSGQFASLALDGAGLPRIAYYESSARELRYAAYDGSSWSVVTVDTAGRVGQYSSLTLDAGGNPRIAYYDATNRQLDYTTGSGASWNVPMVVDSTGMPGQYASLALDPLTGHPRVSYYDQQKSQLRYAAWDGSAWAIQTVNAAAAGGRYTSLALDPLTGYPRISYCSAAGTLCLASWDGSSWTNATVDGSAASVGMYSSLALDPVTRSPRIAYYDGTNLDLKYAAWNGVIWKITTVDSTGDVGPWCSLALDRSTGSPRISYRDATNKSLKYASWSIVWTTVTVDKGNNVGLYTSLALDPFTGAPRIAYYDQTAQDLKFAEQ